MKTLPEPIFRSWTLSLRLVVSKRCSFVRCSQAWSPNNCHPSQALCEQCSQVLNANGDSFGQVAAEEGWQHAHATRLSDKQRRIYDAVCCVLPILPLRTKHSQDKAYKMLWYVLDRTRLSLVLLLACNANGGLLEEQHVQGLSTNHTLNSTLKPDLASRDLLQPLTAVSEAHELQERQNPPSNLIIADPARPPTFIYYCGVLTQICANIAEALSNARGLDGAYTTTLGYAPATKNTDKRRRQACRTFAPKCLSYYACDTVSWIALM